MGRLGDGFRRVVGAPFRALLPRNPILRVLVYALPVLLVLGLIEPLIGLVARGFELIFDVLQPLLETTAGRILVLVVVLVLVALLLGRLLRERLRVVRGRAALGRHLQAVGQLVEDRDHRAEDGLRRVARYRGPRPTEYPHLVEDADLKLARLALGRGEIDAALHWMSRLREKGLPRELRRSAAQLRARILLEQGEVLSETVESELRESVRAFPDDFVLHGLLRRCLRERGDLDEAAAVAGRRVRLAPPAAVEEARQDALLDALAAGRRALEAGRTDAARRWAKKARELDPEGPGPGCLLGEVLLAEGDPRAAITEWGRTGSPEGLDLVAGLLRDRPDVMEPRELLERCPMQGTLLLVAREYARRGETDKAERAARRAARLLGPTPTVAAVLAEVLQWIGKEREASLLCEDAVQRLIAPDRDTG